MEDEWLKFKKYPHICRPLTKRKDSGWVKEYVTNPVKIANHPFKPLLHRTLYHRKYRPNADAAKTKTGKRERCEQNKKTRDIYFASHLDSIVYGYYSHLLTTSYEDYLAEKPYGNSAVAYRKIPIEQGKKGNKSNIEFAYEAFDFIEKNKSRKLSMIVADVTAFFDNLDHRILHSQWKRILKVENLPEDHYRVYKSLISKRFVNENELFKRFQNSLIVERFLPNDPTKTELKRKRVNKIWNLKREGVVAFCDEDEFLNKGIDLIRYDKPHNKTHRLNQGKAILKGIPQGTPISATLANIYMLDFDEIVYEAARFNNRNAFYQRYSDDLIIVCDQRDEQYFYDLIRTEIEDSAKLDIQPNKTNIYQYSLNQNGILAGGIVQSEKINHNKQLEYLGFEYDGTRVRVKTAGFSKFYRTMKRSIKRGVHFAKKDHIKSSKLHEGKLYKRFTHIGSKRRLKYLPDPSSPTGYKKSKQYDWGNFISYLNKANEVMKSINGDDSIKQQYRKIWPNFHKEKSKAYSKIGKKP
ncbi:MAG: hypothetical protein GW839_06985 [Flavobacteriales bacterium]|nr:hypothetical protein [Flavobacteriales bacterium]PIV93797.1 MAG: hypothetical protein COW44_07595 [Flavobacteriaceae bacterium CG17_big_fil_post_rev_8_21_14_2_50_33_15]